MIENELPILEYDSDQTAVIMPDHEKIPVKLPAKAIFAFFGGRLMAMSIVKCDHCGTF
ncbi:hypothetical protein [Aerococcus christensenii]|uniref:hypothetical protein n=1 Tax=Aerococcus christensenii TaxID=87541 RepID=UPI000B034B49|nr:hypothetical protein [Aerococcus christensenii]